MNALSATFAGLAALAVAMGIGRFAFTPLLPMMQSDVGLTLTEGGWLASANYLGYLAGALSAIRLPLSSSTTIRVGLLLISVSTLAMGLYQSFAYWFVLRVVAGVASAWLLVFVSAWALARASMRGGVYAGVGVGIAVAGAVCLELMTWHASSATAWITLGIVSFAATACLWRVFETGANAAAQAAPIRFDSHDWPLVLCYGAFGFGYIIPATFLPAMGKMVIVEPNLFGWVWPVFGIAAAASTLVSGVFSNQRKVWIVASLLMAAGVVLPLILSGMLGILLSALLVGGTFMVITMAGMQEARRVAAERARPLMAAMTSAFALGQIAGPLVAGYTHSLTQALIAAAVILTMSAVALTRDRANMQPGCSASVIQGN